MGHLDKIREMVRRLVRPAHRLPPLTHEDRAVLVVSNNLIRRELLIYAIADALVKPLAILQQGTEDWRQLELAAQSSLEYDFFRKRLEDANCLVCAVATEVVYPVAFDAIILLDSERWSLIRSGAASAKGTWAPA